MTDQMRERARTLIGQLDMPQREVAARIGIDDSKLAKALSGVRKFTISELAALAELGKTSTDWLISGQTPRTVAFAFRAAEASVEDAATVHLSDEVEMVAERRASLIEDAMIEAPRKLPQPKSTWSDVAWGTAAANLALAELDARLYELTNEELYDLVEEKFQADVLVRPLPIDCDGASYEDDDARVIVLAQQSTSGRQRFTLGHELGHIFNGDSRGRLLGEAMEGGRPKVSAERRASAFAGSFLMPEDQVKDWLAGRSAVDCFNEFVYAFNVSPKSASWRLLNLKLISEAEQSRLGRRTSKKCAAAIDCEAEQAIADAAAARARRPLRLVSAAIEAFRAGLIATGPVAALMGVTREEAREILERDEESAIDEDA